MRFSEGRDIFGSNYICSPPSPLIFFFDRADIAGNVQILPSVSTIILSGRTQSFVGLEESITLKIVRQNRPTNSSDNMSDKILPGRSESENESLHTKIVKL